MKPVFSTGFFIYRMQQKVNPQIFYFINNQITVSFTALKLLCTFVL